MVRDNRRKRKRRRKRRRTDEYNGRKEKYERVKET